MSIAKEEAITILQHLAEIIRSGDYQETFRMAASALRSLTREQAEKVRRGGVGMVRRSSWNPY